MSLIDLLLVFCVFCSLLELVHSQSFPYVSFQGETLANHSYVNLSLVGSSEIDSVRCHTDLSTCCSASEGVHRGDWYFPDGVRLPLLGIGDVYEHREDRRVDLRNVTSASSPAGIYRCDIPTNAVHDDTDISVRETVYVGLFPSEGGELFLVLTMSDIMNGHFTITCISSGGPATNVTWIRDSVAVTEGTETVLDDPVLSQYTHTLSGNSAGVYACTVSNNRPSTVSASITVAGVPCLPGTTGIDCSNVVDCGTIEAPVNGAVSFSSTTYNSTAYFSCNDGYMLAGDETITCLASGVWSIDTYAVCALVDCGGLEDPPNGTVTLSVTTYESVANYSCNAGYNLNGGSSRICLNTSEWSGSRPHCSIVDCGYPEAPRNGSVSVSLTTFSSEANITCDEGYILIGGETRTCTGSGTWSNPDVECRLATVLPYITLGVTEGVDTNSVSFDGYFSQLISVEFPLGLQVQSAVQVGVDGTFSFDGGLSLVAPYLSVICLDCGGQVYFEVHNSNTSMSLISKVNALVNQHLQTNFEGQWFLASMWEDIKPYPYVENVTNTFQGILVTDFERSYAVFTYYCGDLDFSGDFIGFFTGDGISVVHEASFSGTAQSIACLNVPNSPWVNVVYGISGSAIECGEPESTANGVISVSTTTFSSIASYSCHEGYTLIGEHNRTCLSTGVWSDSTPHCTLIPHVTDISGDIVASRGQIITLRCGGSGDFPLNVSWLTPSGQVHTSIIGENDDERQRLMPYSSWVAETFTITVTSAADGGSYTCKAENEGGGVNASVVVYVTPYFTTEPSDIITTNGSIEIATCRAEAFPPPDLRWVATNKTNFRSGSDGGSGDDGSGFESPGPLVYYDENLTDNESLLFDPVLFGDERFLYWCIASNDYGEVYASLNIVVSPYGSVRVSPHNAVFNNGDSVNLTCLADGGPGITYQWTFNGSLLENEQNNQLMLSFVNATENGGYFTCIVFNQAGNGSDSTAVFVYPVITYHPSDILVTNVHTYTHLQCEATSFPYPEFQWFNASGDIPYYAFVYFYRNELHIDVYYYFHYYQVCVFGDQDYYYYYYYYCDYYFDYYQPPYGDYYCTATSNNVTVVSETATVYIIPFLVKVTVSPEKEVYEEGDVLYLNCTHGGGPDNEYQWLFNDQEVENEDGPYLTVTLSNEDGGHYMCNVTNPAGNDSGSVLFETKPVIEVSPKDTYSSVGGEVKFTCKARGLPTPYYLWTKTNSSLPENRSIVTNEDGLSSLTIFSVMLEDYGEYNCIAVSGDSIQVSALLIVTTPYIMLGVTEGVDTYLVAFNIDGLTVPISVTFPFGFHQENYTYVGSNGYFAFDHFAPQEPFIFDDTTNLSLVAPFFTTANQGAQRQIDYEIHTTNTSRSIFSQINALVNQYQHAEFSGEWLIVASWEDNYYANFTNAFQGLLVTDFERSYAVFTYFCGDLGFSDNVTIGFATGDGMFANHESSLSGNAQSIACLNIPDSPWVNIVYGISSSAIDCGSLEDPLNGKVDAPNTTYASFARYSCLHGYALVGESMRACLITSLWSGSEPQCLLTPNITEISEDMVVNRGQNVTLRCSGTGDTPLNVSWVAPSGEVHNVLHSKEEGVSGLFWVAQGFVVSIFSDTDGGTYTCIADNEGGSANSSLVVYIAPYFINEPLDVFATNGSFQSVTCGAGAFPLPDHLWVAREIAMVTESDSAAEASSGTGGSSYSFFSGSGSGDSFVHDILTENVTLIFDPVTFGDEDFVYWCFVYNEFGVIYKSINVTVSPEGSVSVTSDKEIYDNGDSAVLTCTHLGGPGNIIQWLRNGSLEAGNANNIFAIEEVVIGEMFTCIVTNLAGEGRNDIVLNVAPIIVSNPANIFTVVNQSVEFCCSISSYPPTLYEWFKVSGSLPANVEISNSSCLLVNQVSFGDEGEYYCVGTSNSLSITSSTAILTISPYGSVRVSPYNAVFNNGDSVNLACLAGGGPGNTYQWTFNGSLLDNQNDHVLVLPFIDATENGGNYTCTVTNVAGNGSDSTVVNVYPTITLQPSDTFVTLFSNGMLHCEAVAFPYPDYTWVHVEQLYTPFASGWNTSTLTFNATDYIEGSEGDYYCTATSNGVSIETESATVFVFPHNVHIYSTTLEFAYEEGDTLYLSCMHDGGPNNAYFWWINGQQLRETSMTLIHTISLADEDGGFYNCQVSNPAGQNSNGIYVYTLPTIFSPPVDTYSLVGGVANFTCGARGFPEPSYTWSKTGGSLPNTRIILTVEGGFSRLVISPVEVEHHGEYNCIASGRGSDQYSAVLTVFQEDGVMVSSSQPIYSENDNATLTCTSFGGPENSFQWFKDGAAITQVVTGENNTNVIVIYNVTASTHGGVYTCVVNNSAGNSSESVSLNVAPQFSQLPQDVLTRVGETVQMVCEAVAYPQPTYQWEKLNGDLPANVTASNSTTLTLQSIDYEDEGSYLCTATTNGESIQAAASLIVSPEGSVSVSPDHVVVDGNQTRLILTCTSLAMFGVIFQWRFGDFPIANEALQTLVLNDITPSEDGGHYECIVTNAAGNGSNSATVLFSPVITANPIHQTASNGSDSISFNCSATGYPQPTIPWFRLDHEFLPSNSYVSDYADTSILTIYTPEFGDEGYYYCSALAINISTTSLTATLYISPEGSVEVSPKNKVFVYGDYVTLNCTARGGPDNIFSWIYNDISVGYSQMLTIEHITISDALTYECRVDNPAGNGTDTTQLYLEPRFVSEPADVFTRVNDTVSLTCIVQGNPLPDIIWEYEGELLPLNGSAEPWSGIGPESRVRVYQTHTSDHGLVLNSTTEIAGVTYSDYGLYSCTASFAVREEHFSTSSNITLTISPEGSVKVTPSVVNVSLNDTITATCTAEGGPDNQLTWSAVATDGQVTILQNEPELVVEVTEVDDTVYRCLVENCAGYEETNLTVYFVPVFVIVPPPNVNVTRAEELHLSCCARGFPVPSIEWYHNDSLIIPTEGNITNSYYIPDQRLTLCSFLVEYSTDLSDGGKYACRGINIAGNVTSIPPSFVLVQDRPERPVITGVQNVTSESVVLQWVEPHHNNAPILGFYIYTYGDLVGNVTADEDSLNVTGLMPDTEYVFTVIAFNSIGISQPSTSFIVTTLEAVPSAPPVGIQVRVLNSTSLRVTWEPLSSPSDENGIIIGFELEYSSVYSTQQQFIFDLMIVLVGLEEHTQYSIRVAAFTSVGAGPFSELVVATTEQDEPSSPPATVVAVSLSQSTIQVAWDEVPERDRNGIITMYEIEYWKSGDQASRDNVTLDSDVFLDELTMLEDFQTYIIRVRAYTVVGPGPYSEPKTAEPQQNAPSGPPLNVTSQTVSSSSILVTWDEVPAVQRNGIITKYEVQYNHTAYRSSDRSTQTEDTQDQMIVLVGLHEYTEYLIQVRAHTIVGHGPYSTQTVSITLQDRPKAPPENLRVFPLNSTSLTVSWDSVPPVHQNGNITKYEVEYNQTKYPAVPRQTKITVDGVNMTVALDDLQEYVQYFVRVRAYTIVGPGDYTLPVQQTTLEDAPSGYPTDFEVTPQSPNTVIMEWGPVLEIDQNGVIISYEVVYSQSNIDHLPQSGTVTATETSTSVGPLQPFIPYNLTVRAFTSIGGGPFNPTPTTTTITDATGLTISGQNYYEVKEGENLDVICTPSLETVGLEWEQPQTVVFNEATTVVQYREPLRHTLTIRTANINHNGSYTCSVVGDEPRVISPITASVRVLEKCLEDFSGGVFWDVAFDGDTVAKPCRAVDERFSPVVKVYRRCLSNRRWTSVDFSGCVLSSGEQQVLVIISLQAIITSDSDSSSQINISRLNDELREITAASGGSTPTNSSLTILPQTLGQQYSLLVWKVSYTTAELALAGQLESVFCSDHNFTINSNRVVIDSKPDIVAVMRSDFCECKQVQVMSVGDNEGSGNNEGTLTFQQCPNMILVQELCNGTIASPCDCQPFQECQCAPPYVGDGSLCVLDSDGDGYPDRALKTCSTGDQQTYCSEDTCPFAPNHDQSDTSPCVGDETDCPEEVDEDWNIQWPFTPAGVTVTVSCGVDFVGNATRLCQSNLIWAEPNVTNCQSRVFVDIMERADEAIESEDIEVVLEVVGELVEATADEETPQLPRDLNTTNAIITETLDLLFSDLDTTTGQNETNITVADATVIFEALDNILSESNQASFDSLQEVGVGSQAVLMNAESFGLFAARVLATDEDMRPGQVVNITGENMVLRAQRIAVNEDTRYSFPSPLEVKNLALPNATLANISLTPSFLAERAAGQDSMSVVVASVLFATLQTFLPRTASDSVGGEAASLIISTQIAVDGEKITTNSQSEEQPVAIEFQFPAVPIRNIFEELVVRCVFWDFGNDSNSLADSGWSVENVTTEKTTVSGDQSTVQCSSTHLTSFAVLVDVRGVKINPRALSVVSYIGLSISIICLIFTIIFFINLRKKLFTAVHNFIHLNLAISLLIGYLVFALGVELAASNKIGCKAVTALVQYFFLAAFSWMLCEGVMLYLMLVKVFSTLKDKWWFFLLLGWGIPLPFVIIGLGALHEEYGVKDITGKFQYCWLSSGDGTYAIWTFVAPMLAIILINVVFLVWVLWSIYKARTNQQLTKKTMKGEMKGSNMDVVKHILKATVILLPLLGMTWVFGLLAVNENTAVFAWLFTIFNSLQGVFIFFFHVLRNKTVSSRVHKRYSLYSSTISNKFGTLSSTLRRSRTLSTSSSRPTSLSFYGSRTLSEAESDFNRESIIVQSPKLPVIFEGKEMDLRFSTLNDIFDDEIEEEEESVFGPIVVHSVSIVKVNPGAMDDN